MIKAVIFDFGRVISVQKPRSLFRCYEEDLGLKPDTINTIMFDSSAWRDTLEGRKSADEFWETIGPELGLHSPEAIGAFRCRYQTDEALNHGVADLLRRLHGRYRLAVLSNNPPGLDQWLRRWGIRDWFDAVFCSGDEGLAKPEAAAFFSILERLNVQPGEAVFIDDTLEHVLAARRLGLRGLLFTTAEALAEQLARVLEPRNYDSEPLSPESEDCNLLQGTRT